MDKFTLSVHFKDEQIRFIDMLLHLLYIAQLFVPVLCVSALQILCIAESNRQIWAHAGKYLDCTCLSSSKFCPSRVIQ